MEILSNVLYKRTCCITHSIVVEENLGDFNQFFLKLTSFSCKRIDISLHFICYHCCENSLSSLYLCGYELSHKHRHCLSLDAIWEHCCCYIHIYKFDVYIYSDTRNYPWVSTTVLGAEVTYNLSCVKCLLIFNQGVIGALVFSNTLAVALSTWWHAFWWKSHVSFKYICLTS
jgi:hypothetical protein